MSKLIIPRRTLLKAAPFVLAAPTILSFPRKAFAAVSFDVALTSSNAAGAASPQTTTGTLGGTANLLLAGVVLNNLVSGAAATWNSVSMSIVSGFPLSTASFQLWVFSLTTPSTGLQTLSVSWTGGASGVALAGVSYIGANTSTPVNNLANASATSVGGLNLITVTSAAGNMAVDFMTTGQVLSSSQQTQRSLNNGGTFAFGLSDAAGAGSVGFGWTVAPSALWLEAGLNIVAAGGGGGPPKNNLLSGM